MSKPLEQLPYPHDLIASLRAALAAAEAALDEFRADHSVTQDALKQAGFTNVAQLLDALADERRHADYMDTVYGAHIKDKSLDCSICRRAHEVHAARRAAEVANGTA